MKKTFIIGGILVMLSVTAIISCSHSVEPPVVPKEILLQTNSTLGSYLTDKNGRSLYLFSNDANGQPSCTGGCEAVWPIFFIDSLSADKIDAGLDMNDFATVITPSGKKQLSYKGWPLYYYAPAINNINTPEPAGSLAGDGVGGIWFIAKPDYTIMLADAQLIGNNGKSYKPDLTEGTGKTIYFTDANGLTVYSFKNDTKNKNNFTTTDTAHNNAFPVYEMDKIVVPSILDKTLFASIDVFGAKQLTYKGWPLYYSRLDAKVRGSNKAVSFPSPGIWPVVTKDVPLAP